MSARLREEAQACLLACQLLTRLRLPWTPAFTAERMAATPRYFPLVGALVGLIGAAVLLAAAQALPMPVAVLLSLAATVAATGAFHEDGLADSFDGLGGGTPERALEIMRDSRVGSYGALGLGLTLALKVTALAALGPGAAAAALVAGHAGSRLSSLGVVATSPYARQSGTASVTAAGIGPGGFVLASATAALPLLALGAVVGGGAVLPALGGLALGHAAARVTFDRRLGGYTGDTLGGTQQLSEVGLYLGVLAWC